MTKILKSNNRKQLALIALQGPDSMVTTNAVKIQLAGTLQMHVGVAD